MFLCVSLSLSLSLSPSLSQSQSLSLSLSVRVCVSLRALCHLTLLQAGSLVTGVGLSGAAFARKMHTLSFLALDYLPEDRREAEKPKMRLSLEGAKIMVEEFKR
jgi:hypothetical protein